MKDWIKIETSLMSDPRINRLCNDLGAKGLGIYLLMRVLTDENVKGCKMSTLLDGASSITSRRIAGRVIFEYDLFDKIGGGLYRACPLIDPYEKEQEALRAGERVDERTDVREGERTDGRADKPCNELELEREKRNKRDSSIEALISASVSDSEREYYQHMKEEFPRICQMQQPLTFAEMQRLLNDFPRERILTVLNDMENFPRLLTGYLSANKTCRKWASKYS